MLRKGGNLVVKMFTLFEYNTTCVLALLTSLFNQVRYYFFFFEKAESKNKK